jgi:hypothetical protein
LSIIDELKSLAHRAEQIVEAEVAKVETAVEDALPAAKSTLTKVAGDLHSALKDILPSSWDPKHPSADLFAKAKLAIEAFEASI